MENYYLMIFALKVIKNIGGNVLSAILNGKQVRIIVLDINLVAQHVLEDVLD